MCEWSGGWTYEFITEDLTASDVQLTDFRILVNGTEVTRIRWDNNLKRKSVGYMVGATSVEAGMVKVTVEVMTKKGSTYNYAGKNFNREITEPASGNVTINHRSLVVVSRKA